MSKELKFEVTVVPKYPNSRDCRVILEVDGREALRSEIFDELVAEQMAAELRRKLGLVSKYEVEMAHSTVDFKIQEIEAKDFAEAFAKGTRLITDSVNSIRITKIPS